MPKGEVNAPAERSMITRKVQTNQGLAVVSDQVEMPSTCAAPFFDFKNFKARRAGASRGRVVRSARASALSVSRADRGRSSIGRRGRRTTWRWARPCTRRPLRV